MNQTKILAESALIVRVEHDGEIYYSFISGGSNPARQMYVPSKPIDEFLEALKEKLLEE